MLHCFNAHLPTMYIYVFVYYAGCLFSCHWKQKRRRLPGGKRTMKTVTRLKAHLYFFFLFFFIPETLFMFSCRTDNVQWFMMWFINFINKKKNKRKFLNYMKTYYGFAALLNDMWCHSMFMHITHAEGCGVHEHLCTL